jgi:hypothetical protein
MTETAWLQRKGEKGGRVTEPARTVQRENRPLRERWRLSRAPRLARGSLHLDELPFGTVRPMFVRAGGDEAGALIDRDRAAVEARDREPERLRGEAAGGEVQPSFEKARAEALACPVGMESESDSRLAP